MNDRENKPQAQVPDDDALKISADKGLNDKLKKEKNNTDTAPDEFLSPKADTDQPIDGQVLNDGVLRGEPYDDTANVPPPDKQP
jgi:hypothetical protein